MDEFFSRQMVLMRRLINDFRVDAVTLNTFIQGIEGISAALENEAWAEATFPLLLSMEQINASALNKKIDLTEIDKALIEASLLELEKIVDRFET